MENRIKSVDVLRGFTVMYMVFFHSYILFYKYLSHPIFIVVGYISMGLGSTFIIVSGISFFLFINKNLTLNLKKREIFNNTFKRAFFLIGFTLLFQIMYSILFPSQDFIIHWSLFYVIGISMLAFVFIPFLTKKYRILFYCSLFISILLINNIIIYCKIVYLFFLVETGTFSIIPWANFFLIGMIVGDFILNTSKSHINTYSLAVLTTGIFLMIAWTLWAKTISYIILDLFFWSVGFSLILFITLFQILDLKQRNIFFEERFNQWGRTAFSLYYIHFVIIKGLIYVFLYFNKDFLKTGLLLYQLIIFIIIFMISLDLFLKIWYKYNYKYGLEWMMRKFERMSFFNKKIN